MKGKYDTFLIKIKGDFVDPVCVILDPAATLQKNNNPFWRYGSF